VSGYGLDQIVLRTAQLDAALRPDVIVVSFIADDVRRTELRRIWDFDKPYFELGNGELVLRNSPVRPADAQSALTGWQRLV
jgi:hypothetical protein